MSLLAFSSLTTFPWKFLRRSAAAAYRRHASLHVSAVGCASCTHTGTHHRTSLSYASRSLSLIPPHQSFYTAKSWPRDLRLCCAAAGVSNSESEDTAHGGIPSWDAQWHAFIETLDLKARSRRKEILTDCTNNMHKHLNLSGVMFDRGQLHAHRDMCVMARRGAQAFLSVELSSIRSIIRVSLQPAIVIPPSLCTQ